MGRKRSWTVAPGEEIVPGHVVVDSLGGGARTQVLHCDGPDGEVVVKVLRPGVDGERQRRLLRREVAAHRSLDVAGLASLVAADVEAERPWLSLRHVPGPTLDEAVRAHGPMDEDRVRRIGAAVATTVEQLHVAGRLHLDLKPSNVLLGPGTVVLDLGASHEIAAPPRSGGVGTWHSRSPEAQDPARFGATGPAADVWGLGVTLLYAATGEQPLRARRDDPAPDETELARRCRAAAGAAPHGVRELIVRCLATAPADRPPLAEVTAELRGARRTGVLARLGRTIRTGARG